MPRVRKGSARHRRHKKTLKAASGYRGVSGQHYRQALQSVYRAGVNATRDRRLRKRNFRRLWITRISAACKQRGLRYSTFMHAMGESKIALNRKMLSEIAIADPAAFDATVKKAMGKAAPADKEKE